MLSVAYYLEVSLRVLHVTQPTDKDGVPMFIRRLARAQIERSFEVAVACPSTGELATDLVRSDIPRLVWEATRDPGPSAFGEAVRLRKVVKGWSPDVVHLHSSKAGLVGRLIPRPARVVVFQPHAWSFQHVEGVVGKAALAWERFASRRTDSVICVSDAERQQGIEMGLRGDLRVITNGVGIDEWKPADEVEKSAARSTLDLGPGPLVVCIGRVSVQKGQDVLLRAWEDVARRVPDARLSLVGDGPLRSDLAGLGVRGVTFEGSRDDVPLWLAAADVVAMPSRWEGMSLSMLETMARARPLVASDVAGVREAFGDVSAPVVPPEDDRALADAIVERLEDPQLAAEEGRRLRKRVEERFDFRRTEEAVAALYSELLGGHPKL